MVLKVGNQVLFDNFDVNKPDQDLQLVTLGRSLFLYHVRIDPYNKLALWGIQSLGVYKNDQNATYEFQIYNSKKTKKRIYVSEAVQPDNLCIEEIYNSGNCVAIPLQALKNFIHENKKFTFKFIIKKASGDQKPAEKPTSVGVPEETDLALLSKLKVF